MRPRVLFLTVMPSPYQRQLFQAVHTDERFEIRVIYLTSTASDRDWASAPLSPYEAVLPGRTLEWLGASAHWNGRIVNLLKNEPSDLFVLSDYSAPTIQIAMHLLNRSGKKWIFWGEVPGVHQRGWLGGILRKQLQRPIGGAAGIAAIGSGAVRAYQRLFPEIPIFDIPYFCDLSPFRIAAATRPGTDKPTIDVLFSGQLIERKGVDLLIRAFTEVHDQAPNLRLQLLGTGPSLDILVGMIPLGLRDRINFLGFQQPEAIPKIFAQADIFVLPSRHDGWGVVVNEALGAGLPIIVSNRVGARDLVQNGVNGFVTSVGDVNALAAALLKLAKSGSLRQSFGLSSAKQAAQWDVDEGARRWSNLTDRMLNT